MKLFYKIANTHLTGDYVKVVIDIESTLKRLRERYEAFSYYFECRYKSEMFPSSDFQYFEGKAFRHIEDDCNHEEALKIATKHAKEAAIKSLKYQLSLIRDTVSDTMRNATEDIEAFRRQLKKEDKRIEEMIKEQKEGRIREGYYAHVYDKTDGKFYNIENGRFKVYTSEPLYSDDKNCFMLPIERKLMKWKDVTDYFSTRGFRGKKFNGKNHNLILLKEF